MITWVKCLERLIIACWVVVVTVFLIALRDAGIFVFFVLYWWQWSHWRFHLLCIILFFRSIVQMFKILNFLQTFQRKIFILHQRLFRFQLQISCWPCYFRIHQMQSFYFIGHMHLRLRSSLFQMPSTIHFYLTIELVNFLKNFILFARVLSFKISLFI